MQRNHRVRKLSITAFAAVLLACGAPAFARDPAPAAAAAGTSASSRVAFRVVVLERLDASSGLKASPTRQRFVPAQRRIDTVDGRRLLTIAAP